MNKRDYFAAQAMQAIIAKLPPMLTDKDEEDALEDFITLVANGAYAYADAMMKKRNTEE